jgi:hypothetical protein
MESAGETTPVETTTTTKASTATAGETGLSRRERKAEADNLIECCYFHCSTLAHGVTTPPLRVRQIFASREGVEAHSHFRGKEEGSTPCCHKGPTDLWDLCPADAIAGRAVAMRESIARTAK